jgi:V8-like Glu-specific endopeptidase
MQVPAALLRITAAAWAALLLSCGPAHVGDDGEPEDSERDPFISDGRGDKGHPSVGKILGSNRLCTGTLIGKRTVLTAAHCSFGRTFRIGGRTHNFSWIKRHPSYRRGNPAATVTFKTHKGPAAFGLVAVHDIAVGRLSLEVKGVTPSRLGGGIALGRPIVVVGFGKTHENRNDQGKKRVGQNWVDGTTGKMFLYYGSGGGMSNICPGDSGGPSFYGGGVVGVHSQSSIDCSQRGFDMIVSAYASWIRKQAGGDLSGGGGGGDGGNGSGSCTDRPPPSFTCAQQKKWGKCNKPWMVPAGNCLKTCGKC